MSTEKIIIAIDGYSSCGKSTFAKAIAARLGYIFIDTGAMYRAVTLYALRNGIVNNSQQIVSCLDKIHIRFIFNEKLGKSEIYLGNDNVNAEIRSLNVNANVSLVSQIAEVREKLVAMQQQMGAEKGIVMDGRDIGTVVFPNAELKIFMTADPAIRAMRRYKEMNGEASLSEIEHNIRERDRQDENRTISPLSKAPDAVVLDNSAMSIEQQMEWVMGLINQHTK